MERNREGYLVSETHRECCKCGTIFEKTSRMTLCPPCNTERVKKVAPEKKMLQRAKGRAKLQGRDFNLTVEDISIPDKCPILGIPLKVNNGKPGAYNDSPSLDRIDNNLGYVKGNVWVISQLANAMKHSATPQDLRAFATWVLSTYPAEE